MIDIKQEILDWYNSADESDQHDEITNYIWAEFYDELNTKDRVLKGSSTTALLPSGRAFIVKDDGGMDEGSYRSVVFEVEGTGEFFEVSGYYSSWDGTEWDDPTPHRVTPKEVTVIQYERA